GKQERTGQGHQRGLVEECGEIRYDTLHITHHIPYSIPIFFGHKKKNGRLAFSGAGLPFNIKSV
ncbi:MAG: hypothetical protein IKY91_09655, partial [Akkermansia sp.]|nr:hypothetical protein [Akkermansia sp.]